MQSAAPKSASDEGSLATSVATDSPKRVDPLDSWVPGPRLEQILGQSLSKRDMRRISLLVRQYQFDGNTEQQAVERWMQLAAREVRGIAPNLSPEQIRQLWSIPLDQLSAASS